MTKGTFFEGFSSKSGRKNILFSFIIQKKLKILKFVKHNIYDYIGFFFQYVGDVSLLINSVNTVKIKITIIKMFFLIVINLKL